MSFLREDDADWMRELPPVPVAKSSETKCFKRRSKVILLDTLVTENNRQRNKKRQHCNDDDDDDDDEDAATESEKKLTELIKKCSDEMGDEDKEAPQWGDQVFGPQKPFPLLDVKPESVLWITGEHSNEGEFFVDFLSRDWMQPVSLYRKFCPDLLDYVFNQVAFSSNRSIQRAACSFLCDYFCKNGGGLDWRPDFVEVLRCYGYENTAQELDPAAAEASGPPPNFSLVLKFLASLCRSGCLRSTEDAESYIFILARCLLDRKLIHFSLEIQDCIELLINYFPEERCADHLRNVSKSLARISDKLVNVLYVARKLRGDRERMQRLRREIAFELLLTFDTKLKRDPKQVISSMQIHDLKSSVDFVQLYHHIDIIDMYLRHDPSFKSDAEAMSAWMSVLRGFSVRIFCGDYRTFANKVRNRAAFLISIYSEDRAF